MHFQEKMLNHSYHISNYLLFFLKDEIDRIRSSGGEVIQMHDTYRVNGNLAVSRAIGN